jgi:hypothetical protein
VSRATPAPINDTGFGYYNVGFFACVPARASSA